MSSRTDPAAGAAPTASPGSAAYRIKLRQLLKRAEPIIRDMLGKKATYADVGKAIGTHRMAIFRYAKRRNMARPRRKLPKRKREIVERAVGKARLTVSEIATKHDIPKSTVSRLRSLILGLHPVEPGATRRLRTPQRCPNGHKVNDWPCRTCFPHGDPDAR